MKYRNQTEASGSEFFNRGQDEMETMFAQMHLKPTQAQATHKPLDVVFLLQANASQGLYIRSARDSIRHICNKISVSGNLSKDRIRLGLVAFCDKPTHDNAYATRSFGFTSDTNDMEKTLSFLIASGGDDWLPSPNVALAEALNMDWTEDAAKTVILVTSSLPHAESDQLQIAQKMAERGITLSVIACPSEHDRHYEEVNTDFYTALVQITSGRIIPFHNPQVDELGIIGPVIEAIKVENWQH